MQDADYAPDVVTDIPKSRSKKVKSENHGTGGVEGGPTALPGTEGITITHHFPVARIKRIMQADDDVGKVAQVTPVVVCTYLPHPASFYFEVDQLLMTCAAKALELFMISLVTKAAAEAKSRNSKRVGAVHLKQAITKDEQFDFLSDIVSKVADAPAASGKGDGDSMDVDGKKRKVSARKKKKAEDEDF